MTHRRTARTARVIAVTASAAGAWLATWSWPWAVLAVYVSAVAFAVGSSYARLAAACCWLGLDSDGRAHGLDCTRPILPRRDRYRLDAADRAAFEEIAHHFDDRSAA